MGSHGGYKLLQDASRKIFFKDVHNLWHALQDPAIVEQLNGLDGRLDKVHLYRPWGQSVRDIAGSDRSDQQKTRSTAELCFRIYAAVMYGTAEAGGDKPWENTASRVWKGRQDMSSSIEREKFTDRQAGQRAERQRQERIPTSHAGAADLDEREDRAQKARRAEAAQICLLVGGRRPSGCTVRHTSNGVAPMRGAELSEAVLLAMGRRRDEQRAQGGAREHARQEEKVSE